MRFRPVVFEDVGWGVGVASSENAVDGCRSSWLNKDELLIGVSGEGASNRGSWSMFWFWVGVVGIVSGAIEGEAGTTTASPVSMVGETRGASVDGVEALGVPHSYNWSCSSISGFSREDVEGEAGTGVGSPRCSSSRPPGSTDEQLVRARTARERVNKVPIEC